MKLKVTEATSSALKKPWRRCMAVGRAYELLRTDTLAHVRRAREELGFEYCRFHGIFHDDMAVVERLDDGRLCFSWQQVDKVYDELLRLGIKPFVELNPMPSALASGSQRMFEWGMNVTPPARFEEWQALVTAFARHVVSRYGIEEVRTWYFEVWNEPNLSAFWSGTMEQYFLLYEHAAVALKGIDEGLRVGGPASAKGEWVIELIEHCHDRDIPLDFVSTHLYPQDELVAYPESGTSPYRPGAFFLEKVRGVQQAVAASSRPNLEIHWTEWNVLSAPAPDRVDWIHNTSVDSLFAAALITLHCLELDDACTSLGYWVISDVFEEAGTPLSPFAGTYGLLTIFGIPKASYNAFLFLAALEGKRCHVERPSDWPNNASIVATKSLGRIQILLAHHQRLDQPEQGPLHIELTVEGVDGECSLAKVGTLRAGAGSCYETWLELGRPHNLSRTDARVLEAASHPHWQVIPLKAGEPTLTLLLEPNQVAYVEIAETTPSELSRKNNATRAAAWNLGMSSKDIHS